MFWLHFSSIAVKPLRQLVVGVLTATEREGMSLHGYSRIHSEATYAACTYSTFSTSNFVQLICTPTFIAHDIYRLKQVAAFRATLEEISDSSLLLHVMDVRYFCYPAVCTKLQLFLSQLLRLNRYGSLCQEKWNDV